LFDLLQHLTWRPTWTPDQPAHLASDRLQAAQSAPVYTVLIVEYILYTDKGDPVCFNSRKPIGGRRFVVTSLRVYLPLLIAPALMGVCLSGFACIYANKVLSLSFSSTAFPGFGSQSPVWSCSPEIVLSVQFSSGTYIIRVTLFDESVQVLHSIAWRHRRAFFRL